jgi:N5-(cytidine 5'-diphosphoramidyl)-L-glutamine hydrolase
VMIRVALTMRITQAEGYVEPRDSISHDWLEVLCRWGMEPVLLPNILSDPPSYIKYISPDILIITGGDDIGVFPLRDRSELDLLSYAEENGLPVLGVCRGLQLINYRAGGDLEPVQGHVRSLHEVSFEKAWQRIYGPRKRVNSYHNMGLIRTGLGGTLIAGACDDQGYVEALYHRELAIAAIMWHPERQAAPLEDKLLIEAIVEWGRFWI